jgi:hypothetical protein
MEIIQIIYLKIKLSTTVLPVGHFTDPHPLYCRWFAERRVSLNKITIIISNANKPQPQTTE